jgi:protoporphyrinogen oxidase
VNKKILVLGGGVAGSSIAYYLTEKGYDVTVIEKHSRVGGLARTCYYSGHPYEFGPHIWFWPGGEADPINHTIAALTGGDLLHIDRRLFTYIEKDGRSTTRTSIGCPSARPFMPKSGSIATNSSS